MMSFFFLIHSEFVTIFFIYSNQFFTDPHKGTAAATAAINKATTKSVQFRLVVRNQLKYVFQFD